RGTAAEVEGVAPDDRAGRVVLADDAVSLVADEVVAVRKLAGEAGVTVGVRVLDPQRHLLDDRTGAVDLDDPRVAGLGDHRQAAFEALEAVDLDGARVALLRPRGVRPDDRPVGRDLDHRGRPRLEEDVPVRQPGDVVDLVAVRDLPDDLAARVDDGDLAPVGAEDAAAGGLIGTGE